MADLHSLAVELPDGIDVVGLHGLVCGLACGEPGMDLEMRLRTLVDLLARELEPSALEAAELAAEGTLGRFVAAAEAELDAADLGFMPLLPDDDEALGDRLQALSDWCGGFLAGFDAVADAGEQSDEVRETLEDIGQLAKVDPGSGDHGREQDFAEVVEYLRVAIVLLHGGPGLSDPGSDDIH
jgi:uncharacterized protein